MRDRDLIVLVVAIVIILIVAQVSSAREVDPPLSTYDDDPVDYWIPWLVDEEGLHVQADFESAPVIVAASLPFAFWPNSYNRGKYKGDPAKLTINRESWHRAVDLRCLRGTPVCPVLPGEVIDAGQAERGGWMVRILTKTIPPTGLEHYYAHLDEEPIVKVGDIVRAGQPIGRVGNSGNAKHTKCHLHFQLKLHRPARGYARYPNPYQALVKILGTHRRWPKDTPRCTKNRATCLACLPRS